MKCLNCESDFEPTRSWQKFCCKKCKSDYHNKARADVNKTFAELSSEDQQLVIDFLEAAVVNPVLLAKLSEALERKGL